MSPTTFHDIEIAKGLVTVGVKDQSALSDWYVRMRDVPLSAFGIEDLCKSVRQNLYPEYVVPTAIEAIEKEPLAGEMYDGELAVSFRAVSVAFWHEHQELAGRLLSVMKEILPRLGDDVKGDVVATVVTIEAAIG
jgi:hypothetical protein